MRWKLGSNRHRSYFFFHLGGIDHHDGVPGAAIQEAPVGSFADALLAPNTEDGIDLNTSERRIVLIGDPEHAIFNRAVLNAGRRTSAPSTAFGDDGQFFGFLLAGRGKALGFRFKLELVRHHADGLRRSPGCGRHVPNYSPKMGAAEAEPPPPTGKSTGFSDVRAPHVLPACGAISNTPPGAYG